jgi:hypothetical protein
LALTPGVTVLPEMVATMAEKKIVNEARVAITTMRVGDDRATRQ